jgi:hypothetical protein
MTTTINARGRMTPAQVAELVRSAGGGDEIGWDVLAREFAGLGP